MSYSFMTLLSDRGLIHLAGADTAKFLQGLITNDIERIAPGSAAFAGLLTPQGKILFDFFIYAENAESYWIDCAKVQLDDLVKRLSLYKLRAKIEIADRSDDFAVGAAWGEGPKEGESGFFAIYSDPRYAPLGGRLIVKGGHSWPDSLAADVLGDAAYHSHRISLAVPQGGLDYAYGESFPHEACYDDLKGVDFKKGCYVGQEVVSRMHHKGTAKTRIAAVKANAPLEGGGVEILAGDKPVGQLGSADGVHGIAIIRLDRVDAAMQAGVPLRVGDITLTVSAPPWASYKVPSEGASFE